MPSPPSTGAAYSAVLVAAMACASLPSVLLGALAPRLLPEFDISRGHVGAIVAIPTLGGALCSPTAGRWADRVGARRALVAVFVSAGVAFVIFATAPSAGLLLVGSGVAAIALSTANPATNKSIAQHLPAGRRATVTGLKQSGVQLGTVIGGAAAPAAASLVGWRPTMAVVAGVMIMFAVVAATSIPLTGAGPAGSMASASPARRMDRVLSVYGGLLGFTNAALLFVPLYAVESLGVGSGLGGLALGLAGAAAIAGRLLWPRYVEAGGRYPSALAAVAAAGAVAYALVLLADRWGGWPLLAGAALLAGASTSSATSLVMLAVIHAAGESRAGAASGTVMVGFYLGFGLGAPIHGRLADGSGGYPAVWWLAVSSALIACAVVAFTWPRD